MPMYEDILMKTAVSVVPNWYESEYAKNTYELSLNSTAFRFCCHNPLTPKLHVLQIYIQSKLGGWHSQMPAIPTPRSLQQVEEDIAVHWLEIFDPTVNWNKFIAYIEYVRFRTYENNRVMTNLVIGDGQGKLSLSDGAIQKIVDPLSTSMQVYFRVDKDLRFLNYQEILLEEVCESSEYRFIPEFLEPFASILRKGEFSVHLHRHGDIFIMNSRGLLAANRKGRWRVYDAHTFKNSVCNIIGNIPVGSNLFELMFNLSYRRHGALLVYDPEHEVIGHVVNPESIIGGASPSPDAARAMIGPTIRDIRLGRTDRLVSKKNLFLEIAGLDGAVIFDGEELIAVGAMIRQHPNLGIYLGARTIAAQSAHRYGGIPIRVSSDGSCASERIHFFIG
ncbi:MAG: hypothetical protein WAZ60_06150 [Desulfosalsimonadaceae bacterium]